MAPTTSIARCQVKPDRIEQFLKLIDRHWSILRGLDLITDRQAEVFVGEERRTGRPLVFEIFEWSDEAAVDRAHTHPDVSAAWEAMGPLCEARDERGPFEFENLGRIEL
jgi:quinol monooxygenase YgiN